MAGSKLKGVICPLGHGPKDIDTRCLDAKKDNEGRCNGNGGGHDETAYAVGEMRATMGRFFCERFFGRS